MTTTEVRQTVRYERKREAILESAAQLFNARGLNGVTLADVAQSVGLTTTSVTYYCRRKEDLAAACVSRAIESLDDLFTIADREPTPEARLRRFVELDFEIQSEVAARSRPPFINFWDLRAMTGVGADAVGESFSNLFRRFRTWFADPNGPDFSRAEKNARAHIVFSGVLWAKEWLSRFEIEDYPRCAASFADVLIGGLGGGCEARWSSVPSDAALSGSAPLQRPEVSRDAFLRAATELINEQGYRGASVDRISAKLSVTKGSFYHHNDTKDDLVAQCFERTFEVIRDAHRAASPAFGTGWERLCAIAKALVRFQRSAQGPLLRYSALSATPEAMRPRLLADYNRLAQRTDGVIVDGIKDGSIRPLDPTIAALFVTGMINAAAELHHWVHDVSEEESVELFVRPSFEGVFTKT